jgi:hypothetical protein
MSEIRTARFAAPDEAREKYDAIIPAYQAAFAAEPWYEVSKCGGCSSGYSRQNPGDICQSCSSVTGDEAYTEQELTEKFDAIGVNLVQIILTIAVIFHLQYLIVTRNCILKTRICHHASYASLKHHLLVVIFVAD